ncbi:RSP_7527 family protein [Neptunomonas concharum]|uniref:Uncharacterized protein n=1 Tax=Neptunomonas concharum TaxID=1031538 RepID=A0A5P1RA71_9GAMM|nr:hypothetical protein [Neptunomonas concharum]QEQ96508.1 hypothetical protein F0U83_07190 [Neptunomonas concharum]
MNQEIDIKLDSNGNIDTNYYIQEAHRLRSDYNAELFSAAKNSLKKALVKLLAFEFPKASARRPAHH